MNEGILESRLFYCDHIKPDSKDAGDVKCFCVDKGPGLEDYIRHHAINDEYHCCMRTYLIRDKQTDELAAYFSLKAGLISVNERKESSLRKNDLETQKTGAQYDCAPVFVIFIYIYFMISISPPFLY